MTRLFAVEEALPAAKPDDQAAGRVLVAAASLRRFRASADGSRRDYLLAQAAGLRVVSLERSLRRARACGDRADISAQIAKARRQAAPRRRLRRAARRWPRAVAKAPGQGLARAMTEVPGSQWAHDFDSDRALEGAPRLGTRTKWRRLLGVVEHVFTHFPLELTVFMAQVPRANTRAQRRALGQACRSCRRGAAQCHAQGRRACAWTRKRRVSVMSAEAIGRRACAIPIRT